MKWEVKGVDKFSQRIDRWMDNAEKQVTNVAKGLSAEIFHRLLRASPQHSGDFTANWNYSLNKPNYEFTDKIVPTYDSKTPFIGGDSPAINIALARNRGNDFSFKLGDTIYMTNSASHDSGYAVKIEKGTIAFRPGNEGAVITRVMTTISAEFSTITKLEASRLKRRRV